MERIFQGQIHCFLSLGLWWLTGKPYRSTKKINFKLCEAMKVKLSCIGNDKMLEMPEWWAICQRESHTGSRLSPREREMHVTGSKSGGAESFKSFETQVPDIRHKSYRILYCWNLVLLWSWIFLTMLAFHPCGIGNLNSVPLYWKYVICFLIL